MRGMGVIVLGVCLALAAAPAGAEVRILTLATDRNESVRAVFGAPAAPGRRPAVIFNHGTDVRRDGYEGAKRTTMNVDDFVAALNRLGYVAIAPLRTLFAREATLERGRLVGTPEQWDDVLAFGLRAIAAARRYLAARTDVDPAAIAVMGFSEGGNIALWSAIEEPGYRAVVLLSPAAMPTSTRFRLRQAAEQDRLGRVRAPVFLAVGARDFPRIRADSEEALIPNFRKINPRFRGRTDYPGDHNWFLKVREEFWNDVADFLREHLS